MKITGNETFQLNNKFHNLIPNSALPSSLVLGVDSVDYHLLPPPPPIFFSHVRSLSPLRGMTGVLSP